VDRAGNLYVADDTSNRIRRVDAKTGLIDTIAGSGAPSKGSLVAPEFRGDGGPAADARITAPRSLAFDQMENLLFGAAGRVCRIDRDSGILTVVAGNGQPSFGGDGGLATKARIEPNDIAVDAQGNLFIAEFVSNRIRRVDAKTGIITTVAGNGLPHRPPQPRY